VALLDDEEHNSFGVAALYGKGASYYPALLRSNRDTCQLKDDADGELNSQMQSQCSTHPQQRRFTLSPKQVFQISSSDWAVCDMVMGEPSLCFYECTKANKRGEQ